MDEKDRLLLTYLHSGLAWVPRPFEDLAAKTGLDSAEVFVRIQRLRREGLLTEVGPVWDSRKFHYQSCWVAMWFDSPNLLLKVESLMEHPGVIYACERKEMLNLWFYIALPAEQDLELHVQCLGKMSGAVETWLLPLHRVYKGTDFLNVWDERTFYPMGEHFVRQKKKASAWMTPEEIELVRKLQPFSLTDEPYGRIAEEMGLSQEQVLGQVKDLVQKGYLRRIGIGTLPLSTRTGIKTLVVWQIPEEKADYVGGKMTALDEVLYADYRPVLQSFPYSFYTVLESEKGHAFGAALRRVEDQIGPWPRKILMTMREFKKVPLEYFSKKLDLWWDQHRAVAETAFERGGTPSERKHGFSGYVG